MSSNAVNVCAPWSVGIDEFEDTIAATPVPQASSTVERHRLVSDFHTDCADLDVKDKISEPFRLLSMVEDVQNLADHVKKCKKQMSPTNSNTSSLGILESSFSDFSMSEDMKEITRLADIPSIDDACNKLHEFGGVQSSEMTHDDVDLHHRLQAALAQSVLDQTAGSTTSIRSDKVSRYSGDFFCRSQSCQGITKNLDARRSEICSLQNQLGRNPFHSSTSEDTELQFLEFDSQEFISADKVIDQLKVDEADCMKEFADIASGVMKTVDISCFSGIMGDDEISIRSSILAVGAGGKTKLRPEEFFGLKSDKIGIIHGEELSDADRPNFGKPICSPIKGRKQMPLVDSSASDYSLSVCDASFPSLTAISNMLGEENEASPWTIVKNIMQYKPEKGGKNILKDVSNYKHLAETSKNKLKIEKPTESAIPLICIDDSVNDTKENTLEWKLNNQDYWVALEVTSTDVAAYVGLEVEVAVTLKNHSIHELQCDFVENNVKFNNLVVTSQKLVRVHFPYSVNLAPRQHSKSEVLCKIYLTPLVAGCVTIDINLLLKDVAMKGNTQTVPLHLQINSEVPKIVVLVNDQCTDDVNFGTLPENCSKNCSITIVNYCSQELPLNLCIYQDNQCHCFFLNKPEESNTLHSEKLTSFSHQLNGEQKPLSMNLVFSSPSLRQLGRMTGLIDLVGYLRITMDIPSPKPIFLKKLQLHGCVGETKLLVNCESPVLYMESTPEEAVSQTIGVKNGGIVPLKVQVTLTNSVPPLQTSDDCMFLNKSELQIHPHEEKLLQITFCPHEYSPVSFEREILLAIQPHGEMYEIPVQGKVGANNPRYSCASSGSSVLSEKHHNVGYESNSSGRSLGKRSKSVATTHRQLVWGSVPIGKSQTESCSLRNELSYPIKLLMTLFDPTNSYKLLNEVGQAEIQRKITLHAKECLTFSVTFTPLKCGAAFGKLQLSELSPRRSCNRLAIPLYGYGGIAKLNVRHVARDRSGYMWLNFGQLDVSMSTEMTLFNEGNLEAFASISHVPRGAGSWLQSSVSIDPAHLVIGTGCAAIVRINCCLQCDDLKFLAKENNEVIEMGMLCITCGDEPTRHRLRRIMDNQSVKKLDPTGKPVPKSLNLQDLCLQFPGESVTDVNILNDPQSATLFLYRTFKQYEVTLTAEKLGDKSFAIQACAGMNDATCSSMFKTICDDDVTFTCTSDDSELHSEGMWSIAPSRLTLMYPQVVAGCITVNNNFKDTQMFEAVSSDTFLAVEPTSGFIPPKGETLITVTCLSFPDNSGQMCKGVVKVFLENDAKSVMIKIKKNVTIHST